MICAFEGEQAAITRVSYFCLKMKNVKLVGIIKVAHSLKCQLMLLEIVAGTYPGG